MKPHALAAYLAWNYRGWTLGGRARVVGDMVRAGTITEAEAEAWGRAFLSLTVAAEGLIRLSLTFEAVTEPTEHEYFAKRDADRVSRARP